MEAVNRGTTDRTKAKQRLTKHYTENQGSSNINPTKNRGWTQKLRKGWQFLLHMWHRSCYSCYETGVNKSKFQHHQQTFSLSTKLIYQTQFQNRNFTLLYWTIVASNNCVIALKVIDKLYIYPIRHSKTQILQANLHIFRCFSEFIVSWKNVFL